MASAPGDVTQLLAQLRADDHEAADALFERVYDELHALAHSQRLRQGRDLQTLNTTALVHEAYLKLTNPSELTWKDRSHFFCTAARAMRHILIDYARQTHAQKRGGKQEPVPLEQADVSVEARAAELVALDEALTRLEGLNERLGRVVELRFFAGLHIDETAEALGVSERTVKRDWRKARAFLYDTLHAEP